MYHNNFVVFFKFTIISEYANKYWQTKPFYIYIFFIINYQNLFKFKNSDLIKNYLQTKTKVIEI